MPVWMSELMTELRNKIKKKHIKVVIMKWANVVKLLWKNTYEKTHVNLKNILNVLGKLLKTI